MVSFESALGILKKKIWMAIYKKNSKDGKILWNWHPNFDFPRDHNFHLRFGQNNLKGE